MTEKGSILIIAYYYPPIGGAGSVRLWELSRRLAERGWDITVLTVQDVEHPYRDPDPLARIPPGLEIVRAESWDPLRLLRRLRPAGSGAPVGSRREGLLSRWDLLSRIGSFVCFPDTKSGWIRPAAKAARRILEGRSYSAVLSSSPPASAHAVALSLRRSLSIPWIADFRDPLSRFLYDRLYPTGWHKARIARFERRVLESADGVVANTSGLADYFGGLVPSPADRMVTITNGFDPEELHPATSPPERFVLLHTGSLNVERNLGTFLEGLGGAIERNRGMLDDIEVRLVGWLAERVERQAESFRLKWGRPDIIRILPPMPHKEIVGEMRQAFAMLLVHHSSGGSGISVPCKLYEYFGTGRPVLALCPAGECRRLVESYGAGCAVDCEDPRSVAGAIEKLYGQFRSGRTEAVDREKMARLYSWDTKTGQMEDFVRRLSPPARRTIP